MQTCWSFSNRVRWRCLDYVSRISSNLFLLESNYFYYIWRFLYQHEKLLRRFWMKKIQFNEITNFDIIRRRKSNSFFNLFECFRKLITDLSILQREIDQAFRDSMHLWKNVIRVCKDYFALIHELINFLTNTSILISVFQISIVNYEIIIRKSFTQQFLQNQVDEIEQYFVNKRFRRNESLFNQRDNNRYRKSDNFNNSRFRFSLDFKKCFVCEKLDCWFTNHSKNERE